MMVDMAQLTYGRIFVSTGFDSAKERDWYVASGATREAT
jgi:hypothetical protein